jgi:transposase
LSTIGGDWTAASLYSLVGSCKRHQIDPFAYLEDVLERLPAHPTDRLGELLTDAWLETCPKARRKVAS